MCRVPSCKTRVIGRELGLHEPQIPAREQHLPRLPHLQRGHQHTAILLASPEPFGWWAMSYPLIEGSNGGAYVTLVRLSLRECGIAYGTRVLRRRSLHSSQRTGKPSTRRRETGGCNSTE